MRRLTLRIKNAIRPDCGIETGAVTALTAILMVVLLLMAAMVINTGMAYSEKAQLQNGADAAALAAAGCHTAAPVCAPGQEQVLAAGLVNQNSNDGVSNLKPLDFSVAGQVTATTTTVSGGAPFLTLPFAGITHTAEGRVAATATATWAKTTYTVAIPITFGECEIDQALYPFNGQDRAILTHGSSKCGSDGTPHVLPGGFGWLKAQGVCVPIIDADQWAKSDTGNNNECPALFTKDLLGKTVLVPIFDKTSGNGNNGKFHISKWGLFVVKGFKVDSSIVGEWSSDGPGNSDRGLYGHFIKVLTYTEGLNWGGSFSDVADRPTLIK